MKNLSRIYIARIRQRLTQIELAEKALTTQPTISRIENQKINPTSNLKLRIANVLLEDPGILFPEGQ